MRKIFIAGCLLLYIISCKKSNTDPEIKQETGKLWISGGLLNCAIQLRLNNGDTLVVPFADINTSTDFRSGDEVNVKYTETGINSFCPSYIDCNIVEITR